MKPYNIYIRCWALSEGKSKQEKDALVPAWNAHKGKVAKVLYYEDIKLKKDGELIDGVLIHLADDEDIFDSNETIREKEIAADYLKDVKSFLKDISKTKTYYCEFIKCEHVLGGTGNPGGSKRMPDYDYAQIDNVEVTPEVFEQTYFPQV